MTGTSLALLVLEDAFWSGVAALGFAILFNVPVRTLLGCALIGALGHGSRALFMQLGIGIEAATLASATLVGFVAALFAKWWYTPAPVFAVSGVIPMVPGTFAFKTMLNILALATGSAEAAQVNLINASVNATKTGLILAALAMGIAAPILFFKRQKPVV